MWNLDGWMVKMKGRKKSILPDSLCYTLVIIIFKFFPSFFFNEKITYPESNPTKKTGLRGFEPLLPAPKAGRISKLPHRPQSSKIGTNKQLEE